MSLTTDIDNIKSGKDNSIHKLISSNNEITNEQFMEISKNIISFLEKNDRTIPDSLFTLCINVLRSKKYIDEFPKELYEHLSRTLTKGENPKTLFDLYMIILDILTPNYFLDKIKHAFDTYPPNYKTNTVIIITNIIQNYEINLDDTIKEFLFRSYNNSTPKLKEALEKAFIAMYCDNKTDFQKNLKHYLGDKYEDILSEVKIDARNEPKRKKKAFLPKPRIQNEKSVDILISHCNSSKDVFSQVEDAFEDPESYFSPVKSMSDSDRNNLSKNIPMGLRIEALRNVVGNCLNNPSRFSNKFKLIADKYKTCLDENDDKLFIESCLGLSVIARRCGSSVEQSISGMLDHLLLITNSSSALYSRTAQMTCIDIITHCAGKKIKSSIEKALHNCDSNQVYQTLALSIIQALRYWPEEYEDNLNGYLNTLRDAKYNEVRSIISEHYNENSSRSMVNGSSIEISGITPIKNRNSPGMSPVGTPILDAQTKNEENSIYSDGHTDVKRKTLDKQDVNSIIRYSSGSDDTDPELSKLLQQANCSELTAYIDENNVSLYGKMDKCVNVLIKAMEEQDPHAIDLFNILVNVHFINFVPYLAKFIDALPDEYSQCHTYVNTLTSIYGEKAIFNSLLRKRSVAVAHILIENSMKVLSAQEIDWDLIVNTIKYIIKNDYQLDFLDETTNLLSELFSQKLSRCEALFMSLNYDVSQLPDSMKERLPKLFETFDPNCSSTDLITDLLQYQQSIANSENIDQNISEMILLLLDDKTPDVLKIIIIGILKDLDIETYNSCEENNINKTISVLFECMKEEEAVHPPYAKCAILSLLSKYKLNIDLKSFQKSFTPYYSGFGVLTGIINTDNLYKESEIIELLESIKEYMKSVLSTSGLTRYAVIEVIASLAVKFGDEYRSFIDEMETDDLLYLDTYIDYIKTENLD